MSDETTTTKRRKTNHQGEEEESVEQEPVVTFPDSPPRQGPLELNPSESQQTATSSEAAEPDVDIVGVGEEEVEDDDDIIEILQERPKTPDASRTEADLLDESMKTPTKSVHAPPVEENHDESAGEKIYSSFPCQVIPETLNRMTRTPPEGENLEVFRNKNGRLRIFVVDHYKKFSAYSNLTHKPCAVCNRIMKAGEMHLNFPADLDRRRIWANLLGFKYKDILRSKIGPVSLSVAAGPICTEHFAEECFRNHNFNKAAIEAFGVPVAISPDVKTTPSKKRVPWVCTICDYHSCSVVELQNHLIDHTEEMLKQKEGAVEVPEAGFMCPFCRKCTYGYKTISGYRRHLAAGPIHHCHLRRIYEFAKMNCRATELDPVDSWDNWTRRNVYVAYHGCEPPANEIVLTPSPTKKAYVQNPEERTKMVHDEERRKKAVRSLSFVGKEGGTSVNDHNVMQRQVYLQIRRELEMSKKSDGPADESGASSSSGGRIGEKRASVEVIDDEEEEDEEERVEEDISDEGLPVPSPTAPMGSSQRRKSKLTSTTNSTTASPVKKAQKQTPAPAPAPPVAPAKKRKRSAAVEEPKEPTPEPVEDEEEDEEEEDNPNDPREKLRRKIRDERFAEMVQKRSQQVKRLIDAKKFKKLELSPKKPRKALAYTPVSKAASSSNNPGTSSVEPEESASHEATPEPRPAPPATRTTRSAAKAQNATPPAPPPKASKAAEPAPKKTAEAPEEPTPAAGPTERPLKSMLARSLAGGVRPSMAQYKMPVGGYTEDLTAVGAGTERSMSAGAGGSRPGSSSPGGLFSQRVMGAIGGGPEKPAPKRPAVLSRRPLILSPRKKAGGSRSMSHHHSAPLISNNPKFLISATDMVVETEEVIGSNAPGTSDRQPVLTLAQALELEANGGTVKDQDFEEISKKMMEETHYYKAMEEAIKGRTVTKMRADMRLSRHCIRQIEAARARARLFGEQSEDYQIYYSNDGAQVLSKTDPKWRDLTQQAGPSDQP